MNKSLVKITQVAVLAVVTLISSATWAQQTSSRRGGGFGNMMSTGGMTPDYMLRDLKRFEEALELTKEQLTIVCLLYTSDAADE